MAWGKLVFAPAGAVLLLVHLVGATAVHADTAALPAFNVDASETSVSGLSSGAFFAVQMQVSYSSTIKGAAIFAGGPYHCAQDSILTATTTCMNPILAGPNAAQLAALTKTRAQSGDIDDVSNLAKHNVFMFSGTQDTTVKPKVMDSLHAYYQNFIDDSQISYVNDVVAAHTQPTDDPANKNSCTTSASPYLSNCNYDGAGFGLKKIYGTLNPRATTLSGSIISFDQSEFGGKDMATTGYAYVPKSCADGAACKLHISFHGCQQNYATIQDAYVAHSGYNLWADTNNMIVVYPQTSSSAMNGCWNWWGYDADSKYDEKSGSQMSAMKKIIDRIASGAAAASANDAAPPLPAFNVDASQTSVSGLSAGGFFAVQMQVAFSSTIVGAGVFAGGPYDCAQNSMTTATTTCMSPIFTGPNAAQLATVTKTRAKTGDVDDVANLAKHNVFMFSGTKDTKVKPKVMDSLRTYYQSFIADDQVEYENTFVAAHTQPTDDPANKNSCTTSAPPYLSNCNYDGAGHALKKIYGTLNPRATTLSGSIISFDQKEFGGQDLADVAYAYVPKSCADGAACKLHISFHGCVQNYAKVKDAYVAHSGYNLWADTNNMIVVYPQTGASATNACFNWWGYSQDAHYDEKSGSQMSAMKKIIDRISSGAKPALPAPANLHATGSTDSSVTLAWDALTGAEGYHVYRDGAVVSGAAAITATSFTDSNLASGTSFSYTVAGVVGKSSEGQKSSPVTAKTTGNPPPIAPPQGLKATAETANSVTLTWTAVAGAAGYSVYRDGTKDTKSLVSDTSFTDAGLAPETAYTFTVTASSQDGKESSASSPVSAKTSSSFVCQEFTDTNYAHVAAGRAHDSMGTAYANGSNDKMGLDNVFLKTTLAETKQDYFEVGSCPTESFFVVEHM